MEEVFQQWAPFVCGCIWMGISAAIVYGTTKVFFPEFYEAWQNHYHEAVNIAGLLMVILAIFLFVLLRIISYLIM